MIAPGKSCRGSTPLLHLFLLFRASAVVAPKSCLKVLYQMLVGKWLAQETYRARLKDSRAHLFFGKGCDEDHWRAAIAAGLWVNAMSSWIRPAPAIAQEFVMRSMDRHLASIDDAVEHLQKALASIDDGIDRIHDDIDRIQRGTCSNRRLC